MILTIKETPMSIRRGLRRFTSVALGVCLICSMTHAELPPASTGDLQFPVKAEPLVSGKFQRCEGICFNGEGDLYVSGNRALWRVDTDGEVTKIAECDSNLGLAAIGERDVLYADFGPLNAFDHGTNHDGVVWRITPEGVKTKAATGIGDPNFVLVLEDRTFLVSDDATNEIFHVGKDGKTTIFTTAVNNPNGLALSLDGKTLYIAQIFDGIRPMVVDGRLWAMPLQDNRPGGTPQVVADTGKRGANDGLAVDELGRIYIAANGAAKIYRYTPETGALDLIAKRMPGVASLAFGQGKFDHKCLYATSTRTGVVWKVPVGVRGAPLDR